jgi:hypothetical protein
MQSLLQAIKCKFKEWPESESYFTCDPDGEVRASDGINLDFYPEVEVYESERGSDFGSNNGAIVTKEIFESN